MLSDVEVAVLEFERSWFKYQGRKEEMILERFGWSATRYYAVLNRVIELPAAVEYAPMVVRRLQRIKAARAGVRVPTARSETLPPRTSP